MSNVKWGYLRETSEKAIKAGMDADTGLHRTWQNHANQKGEKNEDETDEK